MGKFKDNKPGGRPRRKVEEFAQLEKFRSEVAVILQTGNSNEYQAATTFLKPPPGRFTKPVYFPTINGMVVGMFAGKKTALVRMEYNSIDDIFDEFPNAKYAIRVGVCFALDRKYKLGDVLVSDKICNISSSSVQHNDTQPISDVLHDTFCLTLVHDPEVKVSDNRDSKVYKGTMISQPTLVEDHNTFHHASPMAIGGEIEGSGLVKFESKNMETIMITGVADYGDRDDTKEWEFTAAMAALQYTKSKLEQLDIGESKLSHLLTT